MSYQYKGSAATIGAGLLTVEQARRRNAALALELQSLTEENADLDKQIRLMRDELSIAYRKLRRQVRDLESIRAQEQHLAEAETFKSTLPEPRYGGREGLEAATAEMMAHESKQLKLSKTIIPKGLSHGTYPKYKDGCRCPACIAAKNHSSSRYRSNVKRRNEQVAA